MSEEPVPDLSTIRAAVELGCRAPSVHNTQPWLWLFDGARLRLRRDPDRQLGAADPHARQATISCGAVLDHVRTACAARRWDTGVTRLPDPADADLLATLTFRPWPDPPADLLDRAEAIPRRYTDRLPMTEPHGWDALHPALDRLATSHGLTLDVLTEDARPRLSHASEQAGSLRAYDPQYRAEIDWWTGNPGARDGIPPTAVASDSERARVGVARDFPASGPSARRGEQQDRARLAVLTSSDESPLSWLRTGEALSAVLLAGTAAGLSTCPLTHITELVSARRLLGGVIGHPGVPQVVVRIGTAPDPDRPAPTPRRPLTEVLREVP
ncbi:Acg family FMN-binding oxidoreductase [Nocardia sp. SSK8]|uniref:Acg family FMN-binding oxidoreductase n=1 Tax=Nocardia sp. SSK8 TaxID=3120154 RepID=UPI00300B9798